MFTQILVPDSSLVTLHLPEDFVGEQVAVIAVVEKKEQKEANMEAYDDRLK